MKVLVATDLFDGKITKRRLNYILTAYYEGLLTQNGDIKGSFLGTTVTERDEKTSEDKQSYNVETLMFNPCLNHWSQ